MEGAERKISECTHYEEQITPTLTRQNEIEMRKALRLRQEMSMH